MEAHHTMEHCGEALDVLALGSVMVEITPTEAGVPLAEVGELSALPGGAACNFSAALARLGVRVALATGVGEDEWGEWLRSRLVELGIDASRVKTVAGQLTTVSFCWVDQQGGKRFYFYRVAGHSDPITELTVDDICGHDFGEAGVFDFSEAAVRKQPLRDIALEAAREAREAEKRVCYAVNYRPASWDAPASEIIATERKAIGLADIVVMNRDEARFVCATRDLNEAARSIGSLGPRVVAVTGGEEGTLLLAAGEVTHVPARKIEVLYDVGAGDVFHAGLLAGLIFGMRPEAAARLGSDAAALWISRPPDLSQLPTRDEVEALPPLT
jgi:5-dehydro-2-deoxygluconokinase